MGEVGRGLADDRMAVHGCAERLADDSEGGMTLGSGLLGAWSLESYMENPVDGSPPRHPFGDDARGRLIYDHGGWMSVPQDSPHS